MEIRVHPLLLTFATMRGLQEMKAVRLKYAGPARMLLLCTSLRGLLQKEEITKHDAE